MLLHILLVFFVLVVVVVIVVGATLFKKVLRFRLIKSDRDEICQECSV